MCVGEICTPSEHVVSGSYACHYHLWVIRIEVKIDEQISVKLLLTPKHTKNIVVASIATSPILGLTLTPLCEVSLHVSTLVSHIFQKAYQKVARS